MVRNPSAQPSRAIKGFVWYPPAKPAVAPPGNTVDFPYVAPTTVVPFKPPTQAHGLPLPRARAIHETLMRPWDQKDVLPGANPGKRVVNPTNAVPATRDPSLPIPANNLYVDPFPLAADVADLGPATWQTLHPHPSITVDGGFVAPVNPTKRPLRQGLGSTGPRRGVRGQVSP